MNAIVIVISDLTIVFYIPLDHILGLLKQNLLLITFDEKHRFTGALPMTSTHRGVVKVGNKVLRINLLTPEKFLSLRGQICNGEDKYIITINGFNRRAKKSLHRFSDS